MLVLNLYTVTLILVLFLFLFFKKNNSKANRILAIALLLPGFSFVSNLVYLLDLLPYYYYYINLFSFITAFAFAPLVYMYIELLCGRNIRWNNPLFYISGLLILSVLFLALKNLLFTNDIYLLASKFKKGIYPTEFLILNIIFAIVQMVYFTLSSIRVYKFKKALPQVLSSLEETRIEYTEKFILLIWILNTTLLVCYPFAPMYIIEFVLSPVLLMVIYGFIIFFGLKYNAIFSFYTFYSFQKLTEGVSDYEMLNDKFEENTTNNFNVNQITDFLSNSKAYLNPNLSLYDVAKELKTSPGQLSSIINKDLQKNFSDLINEYRVRVAKQLLVKKTNLSIEGIATESGFKSRATFYRAFKKHTNTNPSEFVKNYKSSV